MPRIEISFINLGKFSIANLRIISLRAKRNGNNYIKNHCCSLRIINSIINLVNFISHVLVNLFHFIIEFFFVVFVLNVSVREMIVVVLHPPVKNPINDNSIVIVVLNIAVTINTNVKRNYNSYQYSFTNKPILARSPIVISKIYVF